MTQQTQTTPKEASERVHKQEMQEELEVVDASSLFGSSREIGIRHAGSLYRLKITRQGKLILNK